MSVVPISVVPVSVVPVLAVLMLVERMCFGSLIVKLNSALVASSGVTDRLIEVMLMPDSM